ncbi:MAG: hypothetical protein ALAOOOJD_01672 [bacterium]|nr:hypothetical protein [bacterium]
MRRGGVGGDENIFDDDGVVAHKAELHAIGAGRNVQHGVITVYVRDRAECRADQNDIGAGQALLLFIGHAPGELAGGAGVGERQKAKGKKPEATDAGPSRGTKPDLGEEMLLRKSNYTVNQFCSREHIAPLFIF